MGLPLFRTPEEPDTVVKAIEKSLASARSGIRRRPAPRSRNSYSTLRQRLDERYDQYEDDAARYALEMRNRHAARQRTVDSAEAHRHRSPDSPGVPRLRDLEQPIIDRDSLYSSFSRDVGEHAALDRVRALRDRMDRQHLRSRMGRRNAAPTPPYNENDGSSFEHVTTQIFPRPAVITPALSPAPLSGNTSPLNQVVNSENSDLPSNSSQQTARGSMTSSRTRGVDRTADDWRRSRQHLRRARLAQLDGLGDRNRSISPDGAWDTLLTSITPDPQPPSAGTSFASTSAAAATISISNSSNSTNTSIDDSGTSHDPNLNDCDLTDNSNTEDDDEDIYDFLELGSRGSRRNTDWNIYSTGARSGGSPQEHLDGMHRVISALLERDDVSDEWWASVGLSRNV